MLQRLGMSLGDAMRFKALLDSSSATLTDARKIGLSSCAMKRSRDESITSFDVAAAISNIGPAYKLYERAFIENGIDGTMLAYWKGESHEDILKTLNCDLGVTSELHRKRVFLELKKFWDQLQA
jgi:hypothetical protein